jgi:hypothetical protein
MRREPIVNAAEMPERNVGSANVIAPNEPCGREIGRVLADDKRNDWA